MSTAQPTFLLSSAGHQDFYELGFRVLRAHPDVTVLRLRGHKSRTKQAFMDETGAVLQVPWYFGENWDALNDVLSAGGWLPGHLLLVPNADELLVDADADDFRVFAELMDNCNRAYLDETVEEQSDDGGFHVVLQVPEPAMRGFAARLEPTGATFDSL